MIASRVRTGEPSQEDLAQSVVNADICIREAAEAGKAYVRLLFRDPSETLTDAKRRYGCILRDHVCAQLKENGFLYGVQEEDPLEVKVMWLVRGADPGL